MKNNQNTVAKIVIIYVVAALLIAFIYMCFGRYSGLNANPAYSFDDSVANKDVKALVSSVTELGDDGAALAGADAETIDSSVSSSEIIGSAEKKYYSYTAINRYNKLHVRKEPSMKGEILYKIAPGTKGYVRDRGEGWSYIRTDKCDGYSNNAYLEFTELDKDNLPSDFPEEFK